MTRMMAAQLDEAEHFKQWWVKRLGTQQKWQTMMMAAQLDEAEHFKQMWVKRLGTQPKWQKILIKKQEAAKGPDFTLTFTVSLASSWACHPPADRSLKHAASSTSPPGNPVCCPGGHADGPHPAWGGMQKNSTCITKAHK